MLKVRVIPCMLFNGSYMVKTIRFAEPRNLGNPVQFAHVYNARNVDELLFIDMLATEEHRSPSKDIIRDIVKECFMPLTVGGGIRSIGDVYDVLSAGADKVSINSAAISDPNFVSAAAKQFGSQCIVVSIDVMNRDGRYIVYSHRGTTSTQMDIVDWARQLEELGAGELLVTSIDRDGTMSGYDIELIQRVSKVVRLPVIALGGAGKVQDIIDVVVRGNANAVSLASMFHYSGHTVNSIKQRMHEAGIPVRLMH